MGKTINKHIRVDEEHWKRIEKVAHERGISPSRLMISAALEEIEQISRNISEVAPELPDKSENDLQDRVDLGGGRGWVNKIANSDSDQLQEINDSLI